MDGENQSLSSVGSDLNLLGTYEFHHEDIHSSCPEKIIICVDLAQEVETVTVKSQAKGSVPLLACLKNALQLFVYNKSAMNPDHEFALVVLTDKANWFCDFNKDPALVCEVIKDLEAVEKNFESFDTASLYSLIYETCPPPPSSSESPLLSPPYIVRTILIYSRSHSMPVYRGDPTAHDALTMSPYFFLDMLYAHEPPSNTNMCEGIFDILAEMYPRPKALVLDWSFNVTLLFNCFAKLLAHPLQRPVQNKMDHKLDS